MKVALIIAAVVLLFLLIRNIESFPDQPLSAITQKVQKLTIYAPKRQLCSEGSCGMGKFCNSGGRCEPSKKMNGFGEGDSGKYSGLTHFWSSNPYAYSKEKQLYDIRSN
jgi:hypothetical protein